MTAADTAAHADALEEAGEEFYRQAVARYGLETESWAVERVNRAGQRLQAQRANAKPMMPVVLWLQEMTAFTLPGRYVYLSRELLQRAASDDPVAFAAAHEMAHHDLGHLNPFAGRLSSLRDVPGGAGLAAAVWIANHLLIGPEHEAEADARALDLCLAAGYDGLKCLEIFDILEAYSLDHRDIDGVFGPDSEPAPRSEGIPHLLAAARTWTWRHVRGYPCLRDRRASLLARLQAADSQPSGMH